MLLSYYTLKRWISEVGPRITGARIVEVFSQTRDVLHVGLVDTRRRSCCLEISAEARWAHIALREDLRRRSRNTVDLLPGARSQRLTAVDLLESDRIVRMALSGGGALWIELFGSAQVYLTDERSIVVGAFKEEKTVLGSVFAPSEETFSGGCDSFAAVAEDVQTLVLRLSQGRLHFNKILALELHHRLLAAAERPDLRRAFEVCTELLRDLQHDAPRIYLVRGEPKVFSVVRLRHLEERSGGEGSVQQESFGSVNEAILRYLGSKHGFEHKRRMHAELVRAVKQRIRKLTRLAVELDREKQQAEGFDRYETWRIC